MDIDTFLVRSYNLDVWEALGDWVETVSNKYNIFPKH